MLLRLHPIAWLYRALIVCAVVPLFAYLWWRGRKDKAYRQRWSERLGLQTIPREWQHGIVLHCASVGEVIAARPLVQRLLEQPGWGPLTITCSTVTGSRQIRQDYADQIGHWYFPFDTTGAVVRFLGRLRPRLVILLERELWPNFVHQAQALGVPVVLANGRLSASSAASYRRWRALVSPTLASLRLVCVEDQLVADRMLELGVTPARLVVTGNIKSDLHIGQDLQQRALAMREQFGQRPVLTAGSTHAGEDEALIVAFKLHLQSSADSLLVLVPRHPERFDAVAQLLQQAGLRFVRHGRGQVARSCTQVVLGDSMGELMLWYGLADACFVGGSLVTRGGHNPLEVLSLHKPLIAG
ncbi:MAG: 3-deoxy-D-manno-octulosonic acid transferase, partial [Rhodoferax sp.]|nr:3-deoxy-D-manno-octulosonic acid transferase [Rhodoferax sp.]